MSTASQEANLGGYFSPDRFKGRTVLVSGGGGGLGSAAVLRLAAEGATVFATDLQAPERLVQESEGLAGTVEALELNVVRPEHWAGAVSSIVDRYGRLDAMLMSHGVQGPECEVEAVPTVGWRRTLSINLDACFFGMQAVIGLMKDQGYGRIAALASIAGREGNASQTAYSASKAGLIGLVKAVAKEAAPHGVNVNAIAPSMFQTPLLQSLSAERNAMLLSRVPLGRIGYPVEFASLAAWLLSEECSYTTGQTFDLSGGRYSGS